MINTFNIEKHCACPQTRAGSFHLIPNSDVSTRFLPLCQKSPKLLKLKDSAVQHEEWPRSLSLVPVYLGGLEVFFWHLSMLYRAVTAAS